jgi:hypothetical protein
MYKFLACLLALSILVSCKKKSTGYDDITKLYEASMTALQSKDSNQIKRFAKDLLPDDGTIAAMKRKNFHYRGLPEGLEEHPDDLEFWREQLSRRLLRFSAELEGRGILKDLKFIGFDDNPDPEPLDEKEAKDILFTEPFGLFAAPTDTIEYKLGELLKVNGKWKSFTEEKL